LSLKLEEQEKELRAKGIGVAAGGVDKKSKNNLKNFRCSASSIGDLFSE
jgi:hypothetical protein